MSIYTDGGYLERNPSWHAEHSGWKADHIASILKDNGVAPKTICEIGCGVGQILVELAGRLPDVAQFTGFEISEQAFARAATNAAARIDYHNVDVITNPPAERFDVAMAIDVFEHVDDYMGFIRGMDRVGTYKLFHIPLELSVATILRPQTFSRARSEVGHIHYYSRETALATLRDCGLTIVDERFTDLGIDTADTTARRVAAVPRRMLKLFGRGFAQRVLGGFSLLVLAR